MKFFLIRDSGFQTTSFFSTRHKSQFFLLSLFDVEAELLAEFSLEEKEETS